MGPSQSSKDAREDCSMDLLVLLETRAVQGDELGHADALGGEREDRVRDGEGDGRSHGWRASWETEGIEGEGLSSGERERRPPLLDDVLLSICKTFRWRKSHRRVLWPPFCQTG